MTEPGAPRLDDEDRALYERGIAELEEGRFFESHDTLEELWRGSRGDERSFIQGLIQLAVGCYHVEDGNVRGAASQLAKSIDRLEPYPSRYMGIDVAALRGEVRRLSTLIENGAEHDRLRRALPKVRRVGAG